MLTYIDTHYAISNVFQHLGAKSWYPEMEKYKRRAASQEVLRHQQWVTQFEPKGAQWEIQRTASNK